jgi:non-specific serine/threonine protein kinase
LLLERALTLAEQVEHGDALFRVLEGLGFVHYQRADFAAAKASFERSLSVARTFGGPSKFASALYNLGTLAHEMGDADEARELLQQSAVLYEDIGEGRSLGFVLLALSALAQHDDGSDSRRQFAERALALMNACGDRRGAALALTRLAASAIDRRQFTGAWCLLQRSLRLQQDLGDAHGTAMVLDRFAVLEVLRQQHVRALQFAAVASAVRQQAQTRLLASAQRDLDCRLEASRRAVGHGAEKIWTSAPPPAAVIAEVLGSMPARRNRLAVGFGGPMSPRETEVATLVARGYTNREIAQQLVIGEGTVATHIAHILAKLGLRSRAQVSAWAVAHQLLHANSYGGNDAHAAVC